VLLKNRFRVTGALKYSSLGGLYTAVDTETGAAVVVREARARVGNPDMPNDPIRLVHKEARILQRLQHLGCTPKFVDLFEESGHWFVVQERLDADSLWGYAMNFVLGAPVSRTSAELLDVVRTAFEKIVSGVLAVHSCGIVLRDLSKNNVLFTKSGEVKFVDFELSYELDETAGMVAGMTDGYASPEQARGEKPSVAHDYYSLGALLVDLVSSSASGLGLNQAGVLAAYELVLDDLSLPSAMAAAARGLLSPDPAERWHPSEAVRVLRQSVSKDPGRLISAQVSTQAAAHAPLSRDEREEIACLLEGMAQYIENTADYSRSDRLCPASPEVFATNGVCMQFGAAGIISFLWRVRGNVPAAMVDWMVKHAKPELCPPGLYSGLAGAALALLEAGLLEQATAVMNRSSQRDLIFQSPGLYEGAAGWGLANLHFWRATGDSAYLESAVEVGEHLVNSARHDAQGAFWPYLGATPVGLGFGASGVGLFLAFLDAAAPGNGFMQIAEEAVDFDIANAAWIGDRPLHYLVRGAAPNSPKSPHMRHGSGGVGTASLRIFVRGKQERFKEFAVACGLGMGQRVGNKLWQDYGPSGHGEFLIDLYQCLRDRNSLNAAGFIAKPILLHAMRTPKGVAFAGPELLRISCDFASGSAGIGTFLHRLCRPETPRLFMLDDLLLAEDPAAALVEVVSAGN
jgi:serine/threonine protein kinase